VKTRHNNRKRRVISWLCTLVILSILNITVAIGEESNQKKTPDSDFHNEYENIESVSYQILKEYYEKVRNSGVVDENLLVTNPSHDTLRNFYYETNELLDNYGINLDIENSDIFISNKADDNLSCATMGINCVLDAIEQAANTAYADELLDCSFQALASLNRTTTGEEFFLSATCAYELGKGGDQCHLANKVCGYMDTPTLKMGSFKGEQGSAHLMKMCPSGKTIKDIKAYYKKVGNEKYLTNIRFNCLGGGAKNLYPHGSLRNWDIKRQRHCNYGKWTTDGFAVKVTTNDKIDNMKVYCDNYQSLDDGQYRDVWGSWHLGNDTGSTKPSICKKGSFNGLHIEFDDRDQIRYIKGIAPVCLEHPNEN
jgi:hypothetical protein